MARFETWLSLRAGLRDVSLQEQLSAYDIFDDFPSASHQSPQIIAFLGQRVKSSAMQNFTLSQDSHRNTGEIHLWVDRSTLSHESPIMFADCEMHNSSSIIKFQTEKTTEGILRHPLTWSREVSQVPNPLSISRLVYSKIVAPFSTVLSIFAQDFGGLANVAELLSLWLISFSDRPADLPPRVYPRVFVVVPWNSPAEYDEESSTQSFMQLLGREAEKQHVYLAGSAGSRPGRLRKLEFNELFSTHFGGLRVISHPGPRSSSRAWKSLKFRLYQESTKVQDRRRAEQVAFSGLHMKAFFRLACVHFGDDILNPFNFIRASRFKNPPSTKLHTHIATFLGNVELSQISNFAIPVIASALVFDSYPQGTHGFHPVFVFKQFFVQICLLLDPFMNEDSYSSNISSQFASAVETAFCQYGFEVINSGSYDGALHRNVLLRFKELWSHLFSNNTCFSCLADAPEHSLDCNHAFCTACIKAHGKAKPYEPWTFWLDACPLCGTENNTKIILKPDTAGVRAMIVEGGGIKAVIPLAFLAEIESATGLPMGVQEHFDIVFGSSSGALIVLGLFSNRWSVSECMKQFKKLSGTAFQKRRWLGFPISSMGIFHRSLQLVVSFVIDSRYSSNGITLALKAAFGSEQALFNTSGGGTKIAVVATTTEDVATCILTNYNGSKRGASHGYQIVRPNQRSEELLIWQAARASSAAPPYFKPFQGFQDGGLGGHNNPINLALWEQDMIWSRQNKQPDVVLSLGTGFKQSSDADSTSSNPSFLRTRCVPRLFRSFLNFFVGETRWQELLNSLPLNFRSRYHRMNIEFYGDEPELDDLQVIPNLCRQATIQALSNDDVQYCADSLLSSLFYIQLVAEPTFDDFLFTCHARILCRIGPSHQALRPLANRLKTSNANFYLDFEQCTPCVSEKSFKQIEIGGSFSCPITFKVTSLEAYIDIKLDGITKRARSISNCPYVIRTLIEDQGLHYSFGSRKRGVRVEDDMIQRDRKRIRQH